MSSIKGSTDVRPARLNIRGRVQHIKPAAAASAAAAAARVARARAQALPASPTDSEEEGDASSGEGSSSSGEDSSSSSGEDSSAGSDDEAAFVRPPRGGKRGLPKRAIPAPKRARGRARKPPVTDLHFCGERAACKYGCGTLLWPGEGVACCNRGKHILGPDLNPPISDAYLALIRQRFMSQNSRYLN